MPKDERVKTLPKDWIYNEKEINEPPEGFVGFVYIIYLPDGRKYVGEYHNEKK